MLIDSHCHLDRIDLSPYGGDFARFMAAAEESGVEHMLCVSIDLQSYPAMLEQVSDYSTISVSVGVHPNETCADEPKRRELIDRAHSPKVVAIGETGLDYFRSEGSLDWQRERFRTHIRAAKEIHKPLIVHTREAKEDTLSILAEEGAGEVGGVLHCFTEDWDMARRALDMNFYISFSGIVTFKNAQEIQTVAKKVPDDRFLIETDSPYLAPVPYRGKPNYPLYVRYVAECIAKLRGVPFSEVADLSARNFYRLFKNVR